MLLCKAINQGVAENSKSLLRLSLLSLLILACHFTNGQDKTQILIAHRGGVVDSSYTENGIKAFMSTVSDGYQMIELDVRVTRDGILLPITMPILKGIMGSIKKFQTWIGLRLAILKAFWTEMYLFNWKTYSDVASKMGWVLCSTTRSDGWILPFSKS
jgi:hypothetical protein